MVACALSIDGIGGGIYFSKDGATWNPSNAPTGLDWYSVASNELGTKMVACALGGGIYYSTNGGESFPQISPF